jgi:hypothetical protein
MLPASRASARLHSGRTFPRPANSTATQNTRRSTITYRRFGAPGSVSLGVTDMIATFQSGSLSPGAHLAQARPSPPEALISKSAPTRSRRARARWLSKSAKRRPYNTVAACHAPTLGVGSFCASNSRAIARADMLFAAHRTSIDDPTSSPAISRYILPIGPFMISLAVFFCSSLRTE